MQECQFQQPSTNSFANAPIGPTMPRSRRLAFTTSCAAADALIGGSILRPRTGRHIAHESTHSFGDVLPTLALCTEGGDSFNKRLMSQTENVPSSVDVP